MMKKLSLEQSKDVVGGWRWKCKHSYHSSWPGNTFVSNEHIFWNTANSTMNEHRRIYGHENTWVTRY